MFVVFLLQCPNSVQRKRSPIEANAQNCILQSRSRHSPSEQ